MTQRDTSAQTLHRSDSTLKRRACAWCDQTLYKAKRGHCGAIYDRDECFWVAAFRDAAPKGRNP